MNVLVVEDDPDAQRFIGDAIRHLCCRLDFASSCEQSRALLSERQYDWVTLDYTLPDGTALDILRRNKALFEETQVLLVTARDLTPELDHEIRSLGVAAVLKKPVFTRELLRHLGPEGQHGNA